MNLKVKGFSTINHAIRIKLDLTFEEYSIMAFIDNWIHNNHTAITYADYYIGTGIIHERLDYLLFSLKNKGFIQFDKFINRIEPTDKWKNEFSIDDKADQLWTIHPAGTITKVKQRLPKVLKQIAFEDLKEKLINYVKNCKEKESFPKNLDTWLNPKDKHWEAVVINRKKEVKKEVKTVIKFKQ